MISEQNRTLTTKQVAQIFNTTSATIRRWAREKRIPHTKGPGGRYIFYMKELARFMENRRVKIGDKPAGP